MTLDGQEGPLLWCHIVALVSADRQPAAANQRRQDLSIDTNDGGFELINLDTHLKTDRASLRPGTPHLLAFAQWSSAGPSVLAFLINFQQRSKLSDDVSSRR